MSKSTKTQTTAKSPKNYTKLMALLGWGLIFTAVVFASGVYVGQKYESNKTNTVHAQAAVLSQRLK